MGQRGIVVGTESVEVVGIDLAGAVAAQQVVFEKDTHLGYDGLSVLLGGSYLDGGDEVLLAIGAQHADRELRAGQDDGFAQVFEHEAQGRGGVRHGVGSMQHYEAVVVGVVVGNRFHDLHP